MQTNKLEADYNMLDWWKKVVLDNYANFEGRARRSEYWYFVLMNIVIMIVPIIFIMINATSDNGEGPLFFLGIGIIGVVGLALFLPSLAVAVRRLHDTGKSGWWYLIGIIPIVSYIGGLVLFVFYLSDSQAGNNKWGPNPKEGHQDQINEIGTE